MEKEISPIVAKLDPFSSLRLVRLRCRDQFERDDGKICEFVANLVVVSESNAQIVGKEFPETAALLAGQRTAILDLESTRHVWVPFEHLVNIDGGVETIWAVRFSSIGETEEDCLPEFLPPSGQSPPPDKCDLPLHYNIAFTEHFVFRRRRE